MSKIEHLRLITPALVSIGIALLGLVLAGMRDLQRDVTDVRERLARVEVVLKVGRSMATVEEIKLLRSASEASARYARSME